MPSGACLFHWAPERVSILLDLKRDGHAAQPNQSLRLNTRAVSTVFRLGASAPSSALSPPEVSVKHSPLRSARAVVPNLRPRVAAVQSRAPMPEVVQTQRIRGRALQGIRRRHFERHPLCVCCEEQGKVRAATQLDHQVPLWQGGQDVEANRQGLCDDCHDAKTKKEASLRALLGGSIA